MRWQYFWIMSGYFLGYGHCPRSFNISITKVDAKKNRDTNKTFIRRLSSMKSGRKWSHYRSRDARNRTLVLNCVPTGSCCIGRRSFTCFMWRRDPAALTLLCWDRFYLIMRIGPTSFSENNTIWYPYIAVKLVRHEERIQLF